MTWPCCALFQSQITLSSCRSKSESHTSYSLQFDDRCGINMRACAFVLLSKYQSWLGIGCEQHASLTP